MAVNSNEDGDAARPVIFHLATGGLIHSLSLFGSTLDWAEQLGRAAVVPLFECSGAFGIPMYEVFIPRTPVIASRQQYLDEVAVLNHLMESKGGGSTSNFVPGSTIGTP